ncbi:MAG TPA: hypothetical protein VM324_03815 [Egibacteraceae bacterium]|jgi:hypothetical protein|nr:hypothetical protein [Egibacteraceae bacterium]
MLFVALLGAGYVLRLQDVDRAEQARDEAQAEITRLETAVAELDDYRKLAERLEYGNALLASAMEREIAFARVLGDLAVAFPANASLTSLTFTAAKAEEEVAAAGEIRFGESIGRMEFAGYSVNGYAPGVERVLVDFDRVPAFFNTFLTTAAEAQVADKPVMNFNGSVALDRGAYTNRYADGLPLEETP